MAGIGEIVKSTGLPVPPGFVITTLAYRRLIEHNDLRDEINRLLQSAGPDDQENLLALSSRIRNLIAMAEVPQDVARAIRRSYLELCDEAGEEACVSLRSSALGEDAAGQTFAGQFASKLNVAADDLLESYKEVVASKYSPQAMTYRLNRGIPTRTSPCAWGAWPWSRPRPAGSSIPAIPSTSATTPSSSILPGACPRPWWTGPWPATSSWSPGTTA